MTGSRIRRAQPADLPAVQELLSTAALPLEGVQDAFGGFVVCEREEDGTVIGAAGVELYGRDALLRSVVVSATARGAGVGARLVDAALAIARSSGCDGVYLLTTTAERWFLRHGFTPVERAAVPPAVQRSVEFATACPASAAVMALRLTPAQPAPPRRASAAPG